MLCLLIWKCFVGIFSSQICVCTTIFHSIAMETKGQARPEPEWCPLSPCCLVFTVRHRQTADNCVMGISIRSSALQHRCLLPNLQGNNISTSMMDSPLCFLSRAPGIIQQLQTWMKAMAGRIGKPWLLFNKFKNYIYVTVIWEIEALLLMAWIRDKKKVKQIWLGVENNLACGTSFLQHLLMSIQNICFWLLHIL